MYRIIDSRSSGKTSRLILLAKEHNVIISCADPRALQVMAACYGITGIDFISYNEVISHKYDKPIFIDEIEVFLKTHCNRNLLGYTLSNED